MDAAGKTERDEAVDQEKSEKPNDPGMEAAETKPNMPKDMKSMELVTIDDCSFPKFILPVEPAEHVEAIRRMEVKPDDVFICAFPKAGTHWTWEIVSMLVKGKAEYEPRSKTLMMMDFVPVEEMTSTPSPRVFNTHHLFRFLPYQIREKGARIVFISRNPKDVAVSYLHHMQGGKEPFKFEGTFDEFLHEMFYKALFGKDWFDYELDWEKVFEVLPDLKSIHMVYEDMKEDPVGNVERLAEFLGTGASKELCQQIAEACHFDRHKAADKNKVRFHLMDEGMDAQFLKESRLYRKGEVGDWKNWFTVAQNETFDKIYAERMKGSKLTYRYTL